MKSACQESCGVCDKTPSVPSATYHFTEEPSTHVQTEVPTAMFGSIPNNVENTMPDSCVDDSDFVFALDSGSIQHCRWLAKGDSSVRKTKYCERGNVKGACQASCDFCNCGDDPKYEFHLKSGKSVKCSWLVACLWFDRCG